MSERDDDRNGTKRQPVAGGVFMLLSLFLGIVIGLATGEASFGMLVGLVVGIAIAVAIWLIDRRRA